MPEIVLQEGIDLIRQIQAIGAWLESPMLFFTFLGTENFYLLVMPALYWCLEARIGIRVGLMLLMSSSINAVLKIAVHDPRPFWLDPRVAVYHFEGSFGIPSGHAQNAVAIWGALAAGLKKNWAWFAALILAFLIGFSRMYLAVHFPTDVLVGWVIGLVILGIYLALDRRVTHWLGGQSLLRQGIIFFLVFLGFVLVGWTVIESLIAGGWAVPPVWQANATAAFPGSSPLAPLQLESVITPAATFLGFALGAAWIKNRGGFSADGTLNHRILRFILGILGVAVFWAGLGAIFPDGENILAWTLRSVRYGLVGLWITGVAPALFIRLGIAHPQSQ